MVKKNKIFQKSVRILWPYNETKSIKITENMIHRKNKHNKTSPKCLNVKVDGIIKIRTFYILTFFCEIYAIYSFKYRAHYPFFAL